MRIDKLDKKIIKADVETYLSDQVFRYIYQEDFDKYIESLVMRLKAFYNITLEYADVREYAKEVLESKGYVIDLSKPFV